MIKETITQYHSIPMNQFFKIMDKEYCFIYGDTLNALMVDSLFSNSSIMLMPGFVHGVYRCSA